MPTELKLLKKIGIWCLVILSYLLTFVTPMVAAYFFLAQDKLEEAGKGGFFYFMIIGIFGGALIISMIKIINKQKSNLFKTIFRWAIKMMILTISLLLVKYVDYNINALISVLYVAAGGFFLGSVLEGFLVLKFKDYIREVGVF